MSTNKWTVRKTGFGNWEASRRGILRRYTWDFDTWLEAMEFVRDF